jgi:hypothetical protein
MTTTQLFFDHIQNKINVNVCYKLRIVMQYSLELKTKNVFYILITIGASNIHGIRFPSI